LDIYIGILLGAHPILHISRIRVNLVLMGLQASQLQTPHNTPVSHCQNFCKARLRIDLL
jgi:Na+-translocating ferredoxin:NAD+ oxidoreductase RnfE subunit